MFSFKESVHETGGATYTYDSGGRRVSKSVGGTTTYFVYDGEELLGEADASGNLTRSYVWGALGLISERAAGANGLSLDTLPGRHSHSQVCGVGGGSDLFHVYDAQGNTSALVNGSGVRLSGSPFYTPYGTNLGDALNSAYGWGGQGGGYSDGESGRLP